MTLADVIRDVRIFMLRGFLVLLFFPVASFAQFTYSIDQSIPVEINGHVTAMAWAGGLNSPQVNTMDFDGDGKQDLVVFDRAADKIMTYRNTGSNKYEYTPDYAILFPEEVSQWMLLRDFNCDGKKDLFTSDPFGITVFVNTTKTGQRLSWRPFNPGFPLLTKGFNGNINLKINDVDIPAIDDVDNDGDLDILAMRFVGIGTIEWHKNMSMENAGKCDSLQLERVTQIYGGVTECTCGVFAFGSQPCPAGRVEHVGGKSLLTIDVDNDGDRDLLYSEETCTALYLLRNNGTKDNPVFTNAVLFPNTSPAAFQYFPTPYYEDIDFDNLADLVVAPNLYARPFGFPDNSSNAVVRNSVWLYKNTGSVQSPNFAFTQNNFLQFDMIDVGDYSVPALFDTDNDGDEDLFVGYYSNENFRGSIYYFENTGTATEPSYRLINNDFGGFSSYSLFNLKPQVADMNDDGKNDLAFTATSLQDGQTSLYYIPNSADAGFEPNFTAAAQTAVKIGPSENLRITDVNRDGMPDVLIGKATGALQYWQNRVDNGMFDQLTMVNGSYLGLGNSTSRQNPAVAVGDLDADGLDDLVMGDQRGTLSFYGDYRNFDIALSQPESNILFNSLTEEYGPGNFAGRIWPDVGNLFNSNKPAIMLGNTLGGLFVLRNDGSATLPDDPVVGVGPNPLERGNDLQIRSDRNTKVQIFSVLGQKMSEQVFIPANQTFPLALKELAAGMYVAKFTFPGKTVSIKFILI
jgi:hypothetical protein